MEKSIYNMHLTRIDTISAHKSNFTIFWISHFDNEVERLFLTIPIFYIYENMFLIEGKNSKRFNFLLIYVLVRST